MKGTSNMSDTLIKTIFLAAPKEKVWAYLTEKNKLGEWFHAPDQDLALGEDYVLSEIAEDGSKKRQCWGQVQTWEPYDKLVYSFTVTPLNGLMTTVTWELEEAHGGTRLTMQHKGVGQMDGDVLGLLGALDTGWDSHFASLRERINAELKSLCA